MGLIVNANLHFFGEKVKKPQSTQKMLPICCILVYNE